MHEGHRQRLLYKLESGDNLFEHELLEALLFNAYPRRDTNPIAHALLERFPSIKEVLHADKEELCLVEGVGENVAMYLKTVGACLDRCNDCDCFGAINTTEQFKKFIRPRFHGKKVELAEFYFLDKNNYVKRVFTYTSDNVKSVHVDPTELVKIITSYHPYGLYLAHNHVVGDARPSTPDTEFTKRVQMVCSLNNVKFFDHCIYVDEENIYSYLLADELDKIKEKYNIKSILNG